MPLLPTAIATNRLRLRRYRQGDAAWYAEMAVRNRAHLARYESGNAAMRISDEGDAQGVLDDFDRLAFEGKAVFLGVFRAGDAVFVGQIYVGVSNAGLPGYLIGFFADEAHVRRGYIGEAAAATVSALFGECGAERIGLWCDDTNMASQRIAERIGMCREGHVRSDKRHGDGSVTGSLCYGILRAEFAALEGRPDAETASRTPRLDASGPR
jgi:aminoglycoside 6'-N-acetyltransferase